MIEQGVKKDANCDECECPTIAEENYDILQMYKYYPIRVIGQSEVVIDLRCVSFLMNIMGIDTKDRLKSLERLTYYHEALNEGN